MTGPAIDKFAVPVPVKLPPRLVFPDVVSAKLFGDV